MMDDTDDKIRRNLVVMSTAVLLVAWLQIPITGLVEKIAGSSLAAGWRPWIAALLVLFYLLQRYRHSDDYAKARGRMEQDINDLQRARVHSMLRAQASRYTAKGVVPRSAPVLAEMASRAAPDHAKSRPVIDLSFPTNGVWQARTRVEFQWIKEHVGVSGSVIDYTIDDRLKLRIKARAWARLVWDSNTATGLLAPIVLWLMATCVCVWRLFELF